MEPLSRIHDPCALVQIEPRYLASWVIVIVIDEHPSVADSMSVK